PLYHNCHRSREIQRSQGAKHAERCAVGGVERDVSRNPCPRAAGCYSSVQGLPMSSGFTCLHAFRACHGLALVVGRGSARAPGDDEDVGLALGATLGEREARGEPARTVVLRLTNRDDVTWARPAVEWLAERGRRVLVRSGVVLGRELVQSVRRWGVTAVLELAHPRPAHQRALVGPTAEPAATLLLHAQHL